VSDTALRRFVETALTECRGTSAGRIRLERKPSDYYSSFAIEKLTAFFADETRIDLIFKDVSPHGLLEGARRIRPPFAYEPSREIKVYREILATAELGTARCFGTVIDADQQHYWLLLEKVAGQELYQIGEFSIWCDVARWLARMHARLARAAKRHQNAGWIATCDEAYWNLWIDRAEHIARQHERSHLASLSPARLSWLSDRCRRAAKYLCSLPATFVHGEFYASNILVEQRNGRTRICPVDWETAAIGPGLIDLAALVAGSWTEPQKEQLARAYFDALSAEQGSCDVFESLVAALRCGRLLLALKWLGFSHDWQPPVEHRYDWLLEAMQLAAELDSFDCQWLGGADQ
jgi:Ser/Thr protein kinase RdoA (MazF antagonist)